MMGRRRRRKRKRVLAMIAVLLAVLVWLTFDGRIPLSGDRVGTGSGARRSTRAAAPGWRTHQQQADTAFARFPPAVAPSRSIAVAWIGTRAIPAGTG